MDKLEQLLARIGTDDAPTDLELTEALAELKELLRATVGVEKPTAEDIEAGTAIRQAMDKIDTEVAARADAEAKIAAEAAKLLETLATDDDTDDDESDDEAVDESEPEAVAEKVPVAASIAPALRHSRSRVQENQVPDPPKNVTLRAMGAAAGYQFAPTADLWDVADVFARNAMGVKQGRDTFVRLDTSYPEERQLGAQVVDNNRIIESVMGPQAIGAAGGICDPLEADLTHPVCGDRSRPIRDALPRFQARTGGIRYSPAVSLNDFDEAITIWTEQLDSSPGVETKACPRVECGEELEAKVDAVTACLTIGNFQARFNQNQWRSALAALAIAHDRIAEQTLFQQMADDAIEADYTGMDGTIFSVLSAIDKTVAGTRSRLRINPTTRFTMVAPHWLHGAFRSQIAQQQFGSSPAEQLSVADSIINTFFTSRGVNPVWSLDLDVFTSQTDQTPLEEWPGGTTDLLIYPEGTYMFLDGGTLDLGTEVRDSTLNSQNDRQAFWETFERGVKRGCESILVEVDVEETCLCPTDPITSR